MYRVGLAVKKGSSIKSARSLKAGDMIEEIKLLAVSRSPITNGNTETFLKESLKVTEDLKNVEAEILSLVGQKL